VWSLQEDEAGVYPGRRKNEGRRGEESVFIHVKHRNTSFT